MADSDLILPLVAANTAMGLSAPSSEDMQDMLRQNRAQNIQDMYGVKPASFYEFQKSNGGSGWLKALLIVAAVAAVVTGVGALGAFTLIGVHAAAGAAGALMGLEAGAGIGLLIGAIGMGRRAYAQKLAYDDYLGDVATQARAQGQGLARTRSYPVFNNPAPAVAHLDQQQARDQAASLEVAGQKR